MALSKVLEVESWADFIEMSYERNWTDGLPIFPPLEDKVDEMIRQSGRQPGDIIGVIPPKRGVATVAKVAANAVMAGCKPEYFPVVIAAVQAMLEQRFNLQGVQTTTHSCEPLAIISGPVVRSLDLKYHETVLAGAGARSNTTIGRAIRLVLWNIGGGYPCEPCKKPLGHPGRFSYLAPENADFNPWDPIHTDYGFEKEQSCVTMFACEAPHNAGVFFGTDMSAELVTAVLADTMASLGNNNIYTMGETLVIITPNVASAIAQAGWSRKDLKQSLFEKARRKLSDVRPRSGRRPDNSSQYWWDRFPDWVDQSNDDSLVPVVKSPDDIHLLVTGPQSLPWAAVCPGWGHYGGLAVTKTIEMP